MSVLRGLIEEGEHRLQEFKETYSKTMLKTVSAFANHHDGKILIGVSDQGQVTGVKDIQATRLAVENAINDAMRPRPYYEVSVMHEGRYSVLLYTVYKGDRTPYTYTNKAYERRDTSTVEVDRERYDELVMAGRNLTFDGLPYEGDVTFTTLEEQLRDVMDLSEIDLNVYKSLGLYKSGGWNNAAGLLSDSSEFVAMGLDLIKYTDESMTMTEDRVSIRGESILHYFDRGMQFYDRYVRKKDIIKGEKRITFEEVPRIAYREAIINAIIHRDYKKGASNRVEIFPDRIEILSVGSLPVGTAEEEFRTGSYSNLRNPILADIFFRLGYIERMGTGIRRIKKSYLNSSRKPVFEVMTNSIRVTLPFTDSKDMMAEGNLSRKLRTELTGEEERLYGYFLISEKLTRQDVEQYMGIKKTKAVELINALIDKGYVSKSGSGRSMIYKLL